MRKSFWTIPLVLLFTVLSSTTAHADTIVTSGGNVTGINGITIAGTTYNVTWGTVIDTTFAASLTNATAMNDAIVADLTAAGTPFVTDPSSTNLFKVGVDGGQTALTAVNQLGTSAWFSSSEPITDFSNVVINQPFNAAWDEFTVAAVPEPGSAPLTLAGLGVIAVLMWKRRQQAT